MPGNPIERCAIKKFSDNRYNTLRNIVNGVDRLIDESDEDTLELLRFRYWDCPIGCYEWEDIEHITLVQVRQVYYVEGMH